MGELLNDILRLEKELAKIKSLHSDIEEMIKVQADISKHIKSLPTNLEQLPVEQTEMLRSEVKKINENLEFLNATVEQRQSLGEWAMGQLKIGDILDSYKEVEKSS